MLDQPLGGHCFTRADYDDMHQIADLMQGVQDRHDHDICTSAVLAFIAAAEALRAAVRYLGGDPAA